MPLTKPASPALSQPTPEPSESPVGRVDWIWLRHERCGLTHEVGSDWDAASEDPSAEEKLEGIFGDPDVLISRQYVVQRFYPWGQVDLLPRFEWNGIEYLDRATFLGDVERGADGLRRPRLAHDAFICWMTQILWGGRYRSKDDELVSEAWNLDRRAFEDALAWAFGRSWCLLMASLLEKGCPGEATAWTRDLRWALAYRSLRRSPGESVWGQLRHWFVELRHHLHPPFPWIAILGPDGSGKSTVIEGVTKRLAERRLKALQLHWRPKVLWRAEAVPGGVVPDPHAKPPRGMAMSLLKLLALWLEWWMAHLWKLRHVRAKDRIVVSDRYYIDLVVDPRRYRYGGPLSLAAFAFRLFPKPDRVVCLVGAPKTIYARKKEVPFDELERQLARYRAVADEYRERGCQVDVARSIEEVVEEVYRIVIEACRDRRGVAQETMSPEDQS